MIDESAAERILRSVRLRDPSSAAEFLAETQWAIASLRDDIEEREHLERIKIDDDRSGVHFSRADVRRIGIALDGRRSASAPAPREPPHFPEVRREAQPKMSSGRNADTTTFGKSTISLILRSTATLHRA